MLVRALLFLVAAIVVVSCSRFAIDIALTAPIRFEDGFSITQQFSVRRAKLYTFAIGFDKDTEIKPAGPERDGFDLEFAITSAGKTVASGTNESPDHRRPAILSGHHTTRILATFAAAPAQTYHLSLHILHAAPSLQPTKPVVLVYEDTYPGAHEYNASNKTMESTASGRYDLRFVSSDAYPVAMRLLARSDSSGSR
jgi:hypothetical protein